MTRYRAVALLLVLATFLTTSAAGAITPQESQASGYKVIELVGCAWEQTWVNNYQGSPYLRSIATYDATTDQWCGNTTATLPAGHIAVRQDLIAWTPERGEFACSIGGWWTNSTQSHEVWTSYAFNRPCGASWFRGDGRAGILRQGYWLGLERGPNRTGWVQA